MGWVGWGERRALSRVWFCSKQYAMKIELSAYRTCSDMFRVVFHKFGAERADGSPREKIHANSCMRERCMILARAGSVFRHGKTGRAGILCGRAAVL